MPLTAEGQSLLPILRRIMGIHADAEAAVEALHGGDSGELRIVALPSLVQTDLAPIVASFHHEFPDVKIEITAASEPADVAKLVSEARCDIALSDLEEPYPSLAIVPLRRNSLAAVFPPGTVLATASTSSEWPIVSAVDLERHTLVTLPTGTLTRSVTDLIYRHADAVAPRVITTTQRDALVSLAVNGVGVTFVPDVMAVGAEKQGAVIARNDAQTHKRYARKIGMVFRAENPAPKLSAFLRHSRLVAQTLPGTMTDGK